jgi:hypothetical protein
MSLQQLRQSRPMRHAFSVLVALAFGLKALLPTGYMLAVADGQLQLVICPGAIYHGAGAHSVGEPGSWPAMQHAPGVHMRGMSSAVGHGQHAAHDPHAAHGATAEQCPFALASGAGLLAAVHALAEPYFVVLPAARPAAVTSIPSAPPSRHNAPRGPPALA